MKYCILAFALCLGLMVSAQEKLNEYKYIIIPTRFEGFKSENQYQTSTYAKHILQEKGFSNVVYDNDLPQELVLNPCLGVTAKMDDNSGMFRTKVQFRFVDCMKKDVFTSPEGDSREKEYKASYAEAISTALKSLDGFTYQYSPKEGAMGSVTVSMKNDVKSVPAQVAETPKPTPPPVPSPVVQEAAKVTPQAAPAGDVLYAQALDNGFQLVDSKPSIRLKLLKTTTPGMYLAVEGNVTGLVHEQNGTWIYEYYEGDQLQVKELQIKF